MKYALMLLAGLLIAGIVYVIGLQHSLKTLETMNSTLQTQLTTCKAQQGLQNVEISKANEKLNAYDKDLQKIREQFNAKSNELKISLKSVKTCQEGITYLQDMLNELKGL